MFWDIYFYVWKFKEFKGFFEKFFGKIKIV